MKRIILIISFILISISFTSAICTVTFDKETYYAQETITATMSCSTQQEKSTPYFLNWTYTNGTILESDTGTTPSTINTGFFETFVIPTGYSGYVNASLSGLNLEGSDYADVTGVNANQLVINDAMFSPNAFIGELFSVEFTVSDENGKSVDNAICLIYGTNEDEAPIQECGERRSIDGKSECSGILEDKFIEGNQYIAVIRCSCGIGDNACFDEDGNIINMSSGRSAYTFTVSTWLDINTITDKSTYGLKDIIKVCANVTSVDSDERESLHIYNQVRCSAGTDNPGDTDRVIIISDDSEPDNRGVNPGTTQMQCKQFQIPELSYLEGTNSQCYASTEVYVLDERGDKIKGYETISQAFNITSDELNIQADFQRIGNTNNFTSIINLSDSQYGNYNATVTSGNLDVRLNKIDTENLDHTDQYGSSRIELSSLLETQYIKSFHAYYQNGTELPIYLEWVEDGLIELELRDVDITRNGYYQIDLELENFDERSTEALEGIENKTGTFAFSIDADQNSNLDHTVDFIVSAQLEISDQDQIEGFFSCYIEGYKDQTEIQFEHAIIKENAYIVSKTLNIPQNLTGTQRIICDLGFIGLGNDKDTATDTFQVTESSGTIPEEETILDNILETVKNIIDNTKEVAEELIDKVTPFDDPVKDSLLWLVILIGVVGSGSFIIIGKRKKKNI